MAITEKSINYLKIGRLTPYTIENLRILKDFFGVIFKIDEDNAAEDNEKEESLSEE